MSFSSRPGRQKRVLNTGSGPYNPAKLHRAFATSDWQEIRLDIDARVEPDHVGSVTNMRSFAPDASFDAIWSSHNVEHLHTHEVDTAFREFGRVLQPNGFALITCPDLDAIVRLIADGKMHDVIYTSPAGPITPFDMLYGHSASIAAGFGYMAHNTGYTAERLGRVALAAGFGEVRVKRGRFLDLWALALMPGTRATDLAPLFHDTEQRDLLA
ncbi:class I SAM-dependent methyltransferase [Methylobacterium haplocladii]|uniref:Generic methyltransferase n=1 Tax=Methylobacterium haplocladii TaxID=1176176 RepID=A0A512IVS0_9HYPH|nr:methyltransferase domain-containing protein [Methylobacterium haplocladii]GEP01791.1 generic methyltransferase [Methylobacterium haplocladii]GJD86277.1 hypothetical protein HPGCJGGD_4182 [Methylobacterium haplocladii]GLS60462.1 generic methyltransferase [Methylobacterium haplocladii]